MSAMNRDFAFHIEIIIFPDGRIFVECGVLEKGPMFVECRLPIYLQNLRNEYLFLVGTRPHTLDSKATTTI